MGVAMSTTKVLLIVLVVIVVLFVVLVVLGAGKNGRVQTWTTIPPKFDPASDDLISGLGKFFGPPKLKPSDLTPLVRPHGPARPPDKFILSNADASMRFNVLPDAKEQFRTATFLVSNERCAEIVYQAGDGKGGSLSHQDWPKDGKDSKNPTKVSFQIGSSGGSLTMTLTNGLPNCTVTLEQ
jgi:hypothetical protein